MPVVDLGKVSHRLRGAAPTSPPLPPPPVLGGFTHKSFSEVLQEERSSTSSPSPTGLTVLKKSL